jgi:hypothetical protein
MPALLAYLIAVCLLLGGGYGALSWLAAPEPVKVASKAKPKPPPHYAADSEASSPGENLSSISNSDQAGAASSDQPPSSPSQGSGQGAQAQVSGQAPDWRTTSASAGVSSEEVKRYPEPSPAEAKHKQEDRQPAEAAAVVSPGHTQDAGSEQRAIAAKTVKRPRLRQASHRSDRRALALMTLRTIEFRDGRRVTQLLPYRSRERVLAFDPDD